jgi:hypothetical protein
MRTVRLALGLSLLLPALSGCLNNMGSGRKIGDTVHDMNDQARWGRLGDASQYVEASYRGAYLNNHKLWGSAVQLADAEVVHVQVAQGGEAATAFVTYSWYGTDTMTLHQSVVRQRWASVGQTYALMSEVVVQGDPQLLGGKGDSTSTDAAPISLLNQQ